MDIIYDGASEHPIDIKLASILKEISRQTCVETHNQIRKK